MPEPRVVHGVDVEGHEVLIGLRELDGDVLPAIQFAPPVEDGPVFQPGDLQSECTAGPVVPQREAVLAGVVGAPFGARIAGRQRFDRVPVRQSGRDPSARYLGTWRSCAGSVAAAERPSAVADQVATGEQSQELTAAVHGYRDTTPGSERYVSGRFGSFTRSDPVRRANCTVLCRPRRPLHLSRRRRGRTTPGRRLSRTADRRPRQRRCTRRPVRVPP